MKRSRLAAVLLLLLAFACFLTMSVSAELPWDADSNDNGGGSTDGGDTDTTVTDDDILNQNDGTTGDYGLPDWLIGLMSRYSYPFVFGYLLNSTAGYSDNQQETERNSSKRIVTRSSRR